jgi:hypothetical protein
MHTIIEKAALFKGYIKSFTLGPVKSPLATKVVADTTKAAQVDSAKDPNKSAPIPATSPTLSPTLSAMVAGFLGESSAKFYSIFPTKSAPTSAAFV